jgi:hypothetical protein
VYRPTFELVSFESVMPEEMRGHLRMLMASVVVVQCGGRR